MSAHMIFERAPVGAIISWSDGSPKPPAPQPRAFATWKKNNATGQLIRRDHRRLMGQVLIPTGFTVLTEAIDEVGIVVGRNVRSFPIDCAFRFDIVERAAIGSIRILDLASGSPELVHLAFSLDPAEIWMRKRGSGSMVMEEVTADEVGADVVEGRIAA